MKKIFLIDWQKDGNSELELFLKEKFELLIEYYDGANAYKNILQFMPDLIVINYSKMPSHTRATIQAIQSNSKIKDISIYLIDGKEIDIHKAKLLKINFINTTKKDFISQLIDV